MKYLKTFEMMNPTYWQRQNIVRESMDYFGNSLTRLHTFLQQIEDLSYILEDEGYDVTVQLNKNKHIWIMIQYKSDKVMYGTPNGFPRNRKEEGIASEEEYLEYYSRVENLCRDNAFELKKHNQDNILFINCA